MSENHTAGQASEAANELQTVRDFLRYAISRFEAAEIAYGHGTSNATDEAAYLILEHLRLPIDQLDPFLDARLVAGERQALAELIEARVATRKPAAYLLKKSYIRGVPFYVDERVIVPRSYLGELLCSELFAADGSGILDPAEVGSVLDLCTGSGALAALAAMVFPHARVDAVELSPDAAAVARKNIASAAESERIELFEGDLFQPLAGRTYDLIVTNPPYVDAEAMAALPPEYRHEPVLALAGGEDGLDFVRRILKEAPAHLNESGGLLCEIGTGREILDAEYPQLRFLWLDTEESSGEVFWLPANELREA